jgi:hypothetical protein
MVLLHPICNSQGTHSVHEKDQHASRKSSHLQHTLRSESTIQIPGTDQIPKRLQKLEIDFNSLGFEIQFGVHEISDTIHITKQTIHLSNFHLVRFQRGISISSRNFPYLHIIFQQSICFHSPKLEQRMKSQNIKEMRSFGKNASTAESSYSSIITVATK